MWWERAFPDEHQALRKYAMTMSTNWRARLVKDLIYHQNEVAKEILLLKNRLGPRFLSEFPVFMVGDGVTIRNYGSSSPATVRSVSAEEILVTSDFYVKNKAGQCLYVPATKISRSGSFIFTPRKDGTWRLKGTKSAYLLFGRSAQ